MLKKINKIPAGSFLVPMILSMIINTFWPDLFKIGGITEGLLSGAGTSYISGMLSFAIGTRIEIHKLKELLKHQGTLLLLKVVIATVLSFGFLYLFGAKGIWGISGIAFLSVMFSVNPAVQVSVLEAYGYKEDTAIVGFSTAITLPIIPVLIYSIYASGGEAGGIDWMPIFSALFPLLLGFILGNIDRDIEKLFSPSVGAILPFLGWNLGQSMNFIKALQSGFSGLLLTLIAVVIMSSLYFMDTKALGYEGTSGLVMMVVAGVSTIVPPTIAESFPEVAEYVTQANSQILLASIITSIGIPMIIGRIAKRTDE